MPQPIGENGQQIRSPETASSWTRPLVHLACCCLLQLPAGCQVLKQSEDSVRVLLRKSLILRCLTGRDCNWSLLLVWHMLHLWAMAHITAEVMLSQVNIQTCFMPCQAVGLSTAIWCGMVLQFQAERFPSYSTQYIVDGHAKDWTGSLLLSNHCFTTELWPILLCVIEP